jgi:hypothetical protein
MSEAITAKTLFKDEKVLIDTLNELGYKHKVQKNGIWNGYYKNQVKKADILVSKTSFGGYADLGFEKTDEGFIIHHDSMDINKINLSELNLIYGKKKLKKAASRRMDKYQYLGDKRVGEDIKIRIRRT